MIKVYPSSLQGTTTLPSSKSHSIRSILLGAMASGRSEIDGLLDSPDTHQAIIAAQSLGAFIQREGDRLFIEGVSGQPVVPEQVIDCGNSGQVLRFAGALSALSEGYSVFTGDHSIRNHRSIQPLIEGLRGLGGWAESTRNNGYAPLIIKGRLQSGRTRLEGEDSQPVSALLMASAFLEGVTEIFVDHPGETPWIALTLSWLDRLGVKYTHDEFRYYRIEGQRERQCFNLTIPGDFSSAAFPIAAALVTDSELILNRVDVEDVQGDKEIIPILSKMGAMFEIDKKNNRLVIHKGHPLKGMVIDVNPVIDALPILAVLGCFAEGETVLYNCEIARGKESDRLSVITQELQKMGADITQRKDRLIIRQSKLSGAKVSSFHDHRIAMSLIIAGMGARGCTEVGGIDCIKKSYPGFIEEMKRLGAQCE